MLVFERVEAGYGETRILHGLDLEIRAATVHALLGRNGVGKSTTLKSAIGLVKPIAGRLLFDGARLDGLPPHRIAAAGIAYVPETRDIFATLTVRENLDLAARLAAPDADWTIDRVVAFFPNLAARLSHGGDRLSGGERQMLAIGRALAADPRLLLLDEPTEGLAPIVIDKILAKLKELKAAGMTILLVEQNLGFALDLADDVSLMERGRIAWRGDPDALRADPQAQRRWLGV